MATIHSVVATLSNQKHQKQYSVSLESVEGGFKVNFAYGAIGAVQRPGTKTPKPVDEGKARDVYQKLIDEKTGKPCECCGGVYQVQGIPPREPEPVAPGASTSLAATETPAWEAKFSPALLAPIGQQEATAYVLHPSYCAQRKYDGQRMAVHYRGGMLTGFNRLGQPIPVPSAVAAEIHSGLASHFMLDGEFLAGVFVAWDLLELYIDIRELPYSRRHELLSDLAALMQWKMVKVAPMALGDEAKLALIKTETEHRGEGVVFKRLDKPYMPGRPGLDVKFKFWQSCTARVKPKQKQDGHHSFAVEVFKIVSVPSCKPGAFAEEVKWVDVGRVTCKGPLPPIGTYRELKYLYLGVGGRLYQPEDLGQRSDVSDADCGWGQLVHKQSNERLTA